MLRACGANVEELRQVVTAFIDTNTPAVPGDGDMDTQPTLGFQRVIQRAILHAQSANKKEISGANILAAMFGEKDSHAVHFLNERNINRIDVVNHIVHGISPQPGTAPGTGGIPPARNRLPMKECSNNTRWISTQRRWQAG